MSGYARSTGISSADIAVPLSGAALALGGASLMLGIKPRWGAASVAGFLTAASPLMHDFWKIEDAGQRQNEMIHFSKNLALLAAALVLMGKSD